MINCVRIIRNNNVLFVFNKGENKMLRLSKEERYGIVALIDLSRVTATNTEESDSGVERVRTIAERQKIPTRFLEQIFSKFRQAGVVVGKRGPHGGYRLAKNADEITLDTVMEALRPTQNAVSDLSINGLSQAVNTIWAEIESSFTNTLEGLTLADLLEKAEELGLSKTETSSLNKKSASV